MVESLKSIVAETLGAIALAAPYGSVRFSSCSTKLFKGMTNLYRWNIIHSIFMLTGIVILIFTNSTLATVCLAVLSFMLLAVFQKNELSNFKPWGGYANCITGTRFLIISALAIANLSFTALLITGVLALVLDVVDGFVARKLDQTSKMGSLFDLEVDAYYVIVLSSLIWLNGLLPGWIVAVASLRYIFVLIIRIFNFDYRKDKRTALGPIIAGLHFTVLLLPFIIPWRVYFPLCISTAILVLLSFLYSLYHVVR